MKVLIGIDGSEGAFAALRKASRLLSAEKDQIAVYYAPPTVSVKAKGGAKGDAAARARDALSRAVFDQARSLLAPPLAAKVHEIVGTQHPRHGLIVAADEWRADLIVVGARGIGTMQKLLLGSVSDSIAQTSTVPVLVVRTHAGQSETGGLKALMAVDGSEASRHAGAFLNQFTWPPESSGTLIYVMESMFAGEIPDWLAEKARDEDAEAMAQAWIAEHDADRAARRQELLDYARELPAPFQGTEPIVAEGGPAEQIVHAVEQQHFNLVVLGARGLGMWQRMMMGSTSHKVLLHAPASVLIVRQHEKP